MAKYFCKLFLNIVLSPLSLFPVQKDKLTLLNELSFSYGDNLKYINESLQREEFQGTIIFPLRDRAVAPDNVRAVKPMSIGYFYQLLTSKVIITNNGGISYLPLRKTQKVLNTWHGGGPYKRTGDEISENFWHQKQTRINGEKLDYMLSSCAICSEEELKALAVSKEKCLNSGMPRNDLFFSNHPEIKEKVYAVFSFAPERKMLMYAPTYRGNFENYQTVVNGSMLELDTDRIRRAFEERFGGKWSVVIRFHPKLSGVRLTGEGLINATNYPDMQELLYAADAIITDYSSLMWDFSLTGRPCFLFAADIEEYEKTRGFWMPSAQWPYPIAHDNDEMERLILDFDEERYKEDLARHHAESGSFEKGTACETVTNLLREIMGGELWKTP